MSAALVGWDLTRSDRSGGGQPAAASTPAPVAAGVAAQALATAAAQPPATSAPTVVNSGPGTFTYATGRGPIVGTSGLLRRYRVAVEDGIGVTAQDFAAAVNGVLADPRSWIAGRNVRLQQVSGSAPAAFTIYLATPVTSEQMCREDGLETEQFTSCRLASGKVVINLARWLTAVPDYGAPLEVYRAYAVNHEVGHQLGHGHELCPVAGEPAPVMQQQTYGLQGCLANGWPYLNGVRYRGPIAGQ